jgi:hypothetical protein
VVTGPVAPGEKRQRQPVTVQPQLFQGVRQSRIGPGKIDCNVDLPGLEFEARISGTGYSTPKLPPA